MIRGVAGCGFNVRGVARTLDLMVPEAISKKLEPTLYVYWIKVTFRQLSWSQHGEGAYL